MHHENARLKSALDAVERKTPMCFVKQKEAPQRIPWLIENAKDVIRKHDRGTCLFSPETLGFEFEFYPLGSLNAPQNCCSLAVFSEKEQRLTFRLFVGSQMTELIHVRFTKNMVQYMSHFRDLKEEIDADGSVEVGMEIVTNDQITKYIIH